MARDAAVLLRDEVRVQRAGKRPQHIVRDDHDQDLVLPAPATAPAVSLAPAALPILTLSTHGGATPDHLADVQQVAALPLDHLERREERAAQDGRLR